MLNRNTAGGFVELNDGDSDHNREKTDQSQTSHPVRCQFVWTSDHWTRRQNKPESAGASGGIRNG